MATKERAEEGDAVALAEYHIERLRERLLDLSNRNKLLNYRHPERSRTQVRVIDELPAALYSGLLSGKTYRFKGIPDPRAGQVGAKPPIDPVARQHGLNPSFDLEARRAGQEAAQHVDAYIQLLHYPTETEKRLEGMRQEHLTSLQELGVPALYSIFGFLEWYESTSSTKALLSPLVLLPLELERTRERGEFRHKATCQADEPEANRTLAFRLQRDMGVTLPALDGLVESEDLDAYLTEVAVAVADVPRCRVRRMVTLGVLSFARQVMYEDLAKPRWESRGGRAASSLVRGLLVGTKVDLDGSRATADVVAMEPEPLLITDADATQVAAIADALSGRSLVVKGPPGTGKSQTITNLIAAALHRRQKVLFVAEKMAALDVVKKRLDDAGLASHCLALHSTKAKKRDVIDALARSRELRGTVTPPAGIREREAELRQLRGVLEEYMQLVSAAIGALGGSLRDVVWREQVLRDDLGTVAQEVLQLAILDASRMTRPELEEAKRKLADLENAAASLKSKPGQSPWWFVTSWDPLAHSIEVAASAVLRWHTTLQAALAPFAALPWRVDLMSIGQLGVFAYQLSDLMHLDTSAPAELVARFSDPESARLATVLCNDLEERDVQARRVVSICALETALPRHSRLVSLASTLADERLDASEHTLAELPELIAERFTLAEALRAAITAAKELALEAGMPGAWDRDAPRLLVMCGWLAARAGRDVLRARPSETLEDDPGPTLLRARTLAEVLRAKGAALDEAMNGWRDVPPSELRRHATVIRSAGFFGRLFGSAYKTSRLAYLTLTTGRMAVREEMARALQDAAEYLESTARYDLDPSVRRFVGPAFRGIETDFDLVDRVRVWSDEVCAAFPGPHKRDAWARQLLFSGDASWLERLIQFLAADGRPLVVAAESSVVDLSLVDVARLAALNRLKLAFLQVAPLAIDPRTRLADLGAVASALLRVAEIDARIDASPGVRALLGEHWRGPETDTRMLRSAVAASATLEEVGLQPFASAWILSPEFAVRVKQSIALGTLTLDALRDERIARDGARIAGVTLGEIAAPESTIKSTSDALAVALSVPREALVDRVQYVVTRKACDEIPAVSAFCRAMDQVEGSWNQLPGTFEWCVLRTLGAEAMRANPGIASGKWSGGSLDQMRTRIRELERELAVLRRRQLASELVATSVPRGRSSGPRSDWTDDALIQNEIGKKKRHIAIRQLMSRSRDAVLALTPCLMMSPLSVAQFLDDPAFQFDLLVIAAGIKVVVA